MQIPAVDRTPYQRPASVDVVSHNVGKVVPVAPVNPIVSAPADDYLQCLDGVAPHADFARCD